jgi:hypothetical protein
VPPLVFQALLKDQDRRGVVLGKLNRLGQISQIEIGGMPTPEKVHEIGSRQQQTPGDELHRYLYNRMEDATRLS